MTNEPAILRPFDSREAIGVTIAAKRSGRSERTIREWCCLHQIGRRIGGRWAISSPALEMFLEGDDAALSAYLSGDRASPAIASYFNRCGVPLLHNSAPS